MMLLGGVCVCVCVCVCERAVVVMSVVVAVGFGLLFVVGSIPFLEARLAQWIAYQTSNLGVAGSSPALRTLCSF